MRQKSSGISVIETGKPEIGLAPISPDMAFLFLQEIKYSIPTYPSSIISSKFTFSSLPILTRSQEVNSTLVPLFKLSLQIIYPCVFVLPFVTCPTSAGPERIWAIQ